MLRKSVLRLVAFLCVLLALTTAGCPHRFDPIPPAQPGGSGGNGGGGGGY